jgi:hypothetical protein
VVNAQHMKAVPGRKTDVKDVEWIAKLLRHWLLKASFIPDRNQGELRELTRKEMYVDFGEDYFDKQRQQSIVRHSIRRLESLGYIVSLKEPKASIQLIYLQ